ncbi:hypothetical protein [Methylobacterium fujisawaense]|uniref:hypothetical protein n=1 Tax=Methylobacterium fujisawaense TaxID=107400 RepID=UPI00313C5A67
MTEIAAGVHPKRGKKSLVLAMIGLAAFALFPGRSLYYQFVDPYGLYYRLTIDLADKQGRPVGIDVVVGCGVHSGSILGGGSSFDVMAMDAAQYAWAIPDGHALSVRTSPAIAATDTCHGETTDNGGIARDWLPFVIWYDDAADLSHGLAYATQDAYASPRARLVFKGARITRATAAEYRAFKARGPANLLPRYLSDALLRSARPERLGNAAKVTPEMVADPKLAWRNSDKITCRGLIRVPLPEVVRAEVAKHRPADAPKYWRLTEKLPPAISNKIRMNDETYGGGFMRPDTPEWSAERPKVYPQSYDGSLDRLSRTTFANGSYHKETTIAPENLGFMECGRNAPGSLEAAVTGRQVRDADRAKETCFIDGIRISDIGKCYYNPVAYENIDYVFFRTSEIKD